MRSVPQRGVSRSSAETITAEERAEIFTNAGDAVISGSIGVGAGIAAGTATSPTGVGAAAGAYKATLGGAQVATGVGLGYYGVRGQKPPKWLDTSYKVTSALDFTHMLTRPIAKQAGKATINSLLNDESLDTAVRAGEREARSGTRQATEGQLNDLLANSKGWKSSYQAGNKEEVIGQVIQTGLNLAKNTDWERNRRVLSEVLDAKQNKRLTKLLGDYAGQAILSQAKPT